MAPPGEIGLVHDAVTGFKLSKVLFSAVRLGVFDLLNTTGPLTISELGDKLPTPVAAPYDGLNRVLKFCSFLDLLVYNGTDKTFDLSPLSKKYLVSSADCSLAALVEGLNSSSYALVGGLEGAIRSGSAAWKEELGSESADFYANVYKDTASTIQFIKSMEGTSRLWASSVVTAFDLSSYKTVVDLGGSSGALMAAVCEVNPEAKATVVDLPSVVALGQFRCPYASANRLSWVGADFFTQPEKVPSADLFVLSRVISEWDAEQVKTILDLAFSKLSSGGAVLVVESLLSEDGTSPKHVIYSDIISLVSTKGKQRTLAEYTALLESAGFTSVSSKGPFWHVGGILAVKP